MSAAVVSASNVSVKLTADVAADQLAGTARHEITTSPAPGTNSGQINVAITRTLSVSSGAPQTIDLTAIPDMGGFVTNMTFLTHWLFENKSLVVGQDFTIGGGSNAIIGAQPDPVKPIGGWVGGARPDAGWTVDGTHKNILVSVAAGSNVPGKLTIYGRA